jgi:beta-lactamase regulating signal transducer with metallopeptidase domain
MWPHELLLDPLWQRLAMALLHFVWQGALVAAIFAIAVEWLGRRTELRYSLGVLALLAMAACPVVTFVVASPPAAAEIGLSNEIGNESARTRGWNNSPHDHDNASTPSAAAIAALLNHSAEVHASVSATEVATTDHSDRQVQKATPAWQHRARLALAFAWLAGVMVCSLRLLVGAVGLRRLTACVSQVHDEHRRLLARLARAMSLRRVPRLVVSPRVRQAIATGFFRPIIVMPAAWLAELPPSVIEAVLAHELAHIRRHDLWVNLLQRAVEALLFFHPAVWWLSRQIRNERELCCDQLAVAATRRRVEYVSALEVVARRAARERGFSLATGIGGRKMQLLQRVRHVLGLPAAPRGRAWWPAGILALAVPCMLWVLSGPARPALADDDDKVESRERDDDDREDRDDNDRDDGDREDRGRKERERDEADRDDDDDDEEEEREVRKVQVGDDEFEIEIELRGDDLIRDKRARAEAARREKLRDEEVRVDQARREIERARADLERQVGEARERIVEEVRRAKREGNKDQVEALHRKMEAVRREAEAHMRALEAKFRAVSEELGRGVEKQRPLSEEAMHHARAMAEKVEHQMRERRRELGEQLQAAEKAGDKAAIEKLRAAAEAMNAEAAVIRQKIEKQASDMAEKQRAVAEARVREAREMVEKVERDLDERRRAIEEKLEIAKKEGDKVAIQKLHAAMKMMETEAAAVRDKLKRQVGEEAEKQRAVAEERVREARAMVEKVERDLGERRRAIEEKMEVAKKAGDKAAIEELHAVTKAMEAEAAAVRDKVKRAALLQIDKKQFPDKVKIDKSQLIGDVQIDKRQLPGKVQLEFTDKKPTKPRSLEADRELLDMVRQLREEVQQLRREVRELRERGGARDEGDRAPRLEFRQDRREEKPQTSVLIDIPYVGRLFKDDEREEVELRFDLADDQRKDFDKLQTEIEEIQKLDDDQLIKLKDIEVDVELNKRDLDKLRGVETKLEKRELEKLEGVELQNRKVEELKDIELKNRGLNRIDKNDVLRQERIRSELFDIRAELTERNRELQDNKLKQIEIERNKAASDVDVRYAQKVAELAAKEWERAVEANRKTPGAFNEIDVDRLKFAHELKLLEVERAKIKSENELTKILEARKDLESKVNKLNEAAKETAEKFNEVGANKPNPPAAANKVNKENAPTEPNKESPASAANKENPPQQAKR